MTLFISPNLGQDTPLDQAPEWELEQDVESNSSSHHADNIANSKLKDSVEGDKEPIWQLTVNQLDTDWCNQRSNEAKLCSSRRSQALSKSRASQWQSGQLASQTR